jgi:Fe-S-cluster containining protein
MTTRDEIAQGNLNAINARIEPQMPRFNAGIEVIFRARVSVGSKIAALWKLTDQMMEYNGDNVACKRGCSHCCHIAVAMTPAEAEVIGKRIGREPERDVNLRDNLDDFDFGYHNPCTFLKEGECSIYADRPLACRVQYSLEGDAVPCELHPPESRYVNYLNTTKFDYALLQIVGIEKREALADIREFFPKGMP